MNVTFLGDGRDWGFYIAKGLSGIKNKIWRLNKIITTPELYFPSEGLSNLGVETEVIEPKDLIRLYKEGKLDNSDILLFYGWSWIVPEEIVSTKTCICLHPSPLPRYRGGSPIQHQIINGESEGAVSLFQMSMNLDDGPIFKQKSFPLDGHLKDITNRIGLVGLPLTIEMLDELAEKSLLPKKQNEDLVTSYKRRKKSESALDIEKLKSMNSREIYNFIRALEDPYPNAFIGFEKGKLLLKKADFVDSVNDKRVVNVNEMGSLDFDEIIDLVKNGFTLECSDGKYLLIESENKVNNNTAV